MYCRTKNFHKLGAVAVVVARSIELFRAMYFDIMVNRLRSRWVAKYHQAAGDRLCIIHDFFSRRAREVDLTQKKKYVRARCVVYVLLRKFWSIHVLCERRVSKLICAVTARSLMVVVAI